MTTQNVFSMTDTWNAGATTFSAIKMVATDTASAAGSMLLDLQLASGPIFQIRKDGAISIGGGSFVVTTTFGLSLLTQASASAARTTLGFTTSAAINMGQATAAGTFKAFVDGNTIITATNVGNVIVRSTTKLGFGDTDGLTFDTAITRGGASAFIFTDGASGGASIATADPTSGVGPQWKLGARKAATVAADTTQYLEVNVGGTTYKVGIVN